MRIGVLHNAPEDVHGLRVTYQYGQFLAMREHAEIVFGDEAFAQLDSLDAVIAFDERGLMIDVAPRLPRRLAPLLVYVTHDWWAHPLHVSQYLNGHERVLSVVRHVACQRLHRMLAPRIPCIVQRPGVDTTLFQPPPGPKEYDILLAGSESADYPVRKRLNAIVRAQRERRGWNVLDLSDPAWGDDGQREYAPSLASAKVSPTGTPRGGLSGGKLIMQYFDDSGDARTPDTAVREFTLPGAPSPRYLESMATKTLLVADLPEDERWYRDKMVTVSLEDTDEAIGDLIDHWVRADDERTRLCDYAHAETMRTETTAHRAAELVELIGQHL